MKCFLGALRVQNAGHGNIVAEDCAAPSEDGAPHFWTNGVLDNEVPESGVNTALSELRRSVKDTCRRSGRAEILGCGNTVRV